MASENNSFILLDICQKYFNHYGVVLIEFQIVLNIQNLKAYQILKMNPAMKRSQDEIDSGDIINKNPKQTNIFDQIVNTPGLQHIIELIFFNLDFENLVACQLVNKASNEILKNPIFWLEKWRFNQGLSKKNKEDWIKALQMTKNTNFERNVICTSKKSSNLTILWMSHVILIMRS